MIALVSKSLKESDSKASDQVRYVLKVVVCGDWGVGKTSLVRRFAENTFDHDYKPSIGVNIVTKIIDVNGEKLKLQIFDSGGQDRFQPIRKRYYTGANAAIFVFDLTRASSAVSLEERWVKEVESVIGPDFERVVLANKLDLETDREISEYAARQSAERIKASYYETSALDGRNVHDAFNELATRLMAKIFPEA